MEIRSQDSVADRDSAENDCAQLRHRTKEDNTRGNSEGNSVQLWFPVDDEFGPETLLRCGLGAPEDRKRELETRWEKVLYKQQPFADNFTHSSFLAELVLNAHVNKRDYWTVVCDSAAIIQQLSTVASVVAVSVHLHEGGISMLSLLAVCFMVLVTGGQLFELSGPWLKYSVKYRGFVCEFRLWRTCKTGFLLCCIVGGHVLGGSVVRGLRQCFLLTGGVYLLSPLLQTLTLTISGDTIVSFSAFLLVLHLYLHDYNFVNTVTDRFTGSVSLGAAIFSSVLIASRLRTSTHVFVQILFSLELYLLAPFVRRYICQTSITVHLCVTGAMLALSLVLMTPLSLPLTVIYCGLVMFVSFVCPLCLVRLHKFKAKITGPWDEAVPKIPLSLPFD